MVCPIIPYCHPTNRWRIHNAGLKSEKMCNGRLDLTAIKMFEISAHLVPLQRLYTMRIPVRIPTELARCRLNSIGDRNGAGQNIPCISGQEVGPSQMVSSARGPAPRLPHTKFQGGSACIKAYVTFSGSDAPLSSPSLDLRWY